MREVRRGYRFRVSNFVCDDWQGVRLQNVKSKSVNIVLMPDEAFQLRDALNDCLDEFEELQMRSKRESFQ